MFFFFMMKLFMNIFFEIFFFNFLKILTIKLPGKFFIYIFVTN